MRLTPVRLLRILITAGVVFAASVQSMPSAHAVGNGSWSVAPTGDNGVTPRDWFEYELKAGQSIRDMVSVSNTTASPLTLKLYPTDAYNTPRDGAFALLQAGEKPTDAGSWIRLEVSQVTVPGHSRADVPFEINVPADGPPGDHAAGLVAEDATPVSQQIGGGKGVDIKQRVATRVYIRLMGSVRPALTITRLVVQHRDPALPPFTGHGRAVIAYEVTNTGNVRLSGTARATVRGLFGRTLVTLPPHALPDLLPKGSAVIQDIWNGPLPIADHLSVGVVATADGARTARTVSFWKIPSTEAAIVLLIIVLVLGRARWRRRPGVTDVIPPLPESEAVPV